MTDPLSRKDLGVLLKVSAGPCLSLFLPTVRAGHETLQNPIRWKNLLREADRKLEFRGWREEERRTWLQPALALLDDYYFWQHQSDGLAVFRGAGTFRFFRIPLPMPELVVLGDRFHLKPLLAVIGEDEPFYLLALSQSHARLFRFTRHSMEELEGEALPRDLRETLREHLPERQLQSHAVAASGAHRIFHGHGGGEEDRKEILVSHFRRVDAGVHELLRAEEAPLLVAAVEYLHPIYRHANTYPHLLEERITGSPEEWTPADLHEKAVAVVSPYLERKFENLVSQYNESIHTGKASKLDEVVLAALTGRVATLFVALGVEIWGRVDLEAKCVHTRAAPQDGDEDLLNVAAMHAWSSGAAVFAVPLERVPGGEPQAAILRY